MNQISSQEQELTNNQFTPEQLAQWKETGIIDSWQGETLDIGNEKGWKNGSLTIKNCPNLTYLDAHNCGLKIINISNCSNLEQLFLHHNWLSYINGLAKLTKLERLQVTGNKIKTLFQLKYLVNLKHLYCSNNELTKLEVSNLKNLITFDCFDNQLISLICNGLANLEDLNCSRNYNKKVKNGMIHLELNGCINLKTIDADLNDLRDLSSFANLPNLIDLSLKINGSYNSEISPILELNSPKLQFLDTSRSNIIVKFTRTSPDAEIKEDEGYSSGSEDASNEWEQREYNKKQEKLKKDFEKGEHTWQGQTHLDLSNCDYINSITIDGDDNYPKSLVSINLGGNYLSEVIVRNMPNLRRLIISHNKVDNLVIKNCPQLDLIYNYKSDDNDRTPPLDAREYNEKDNPLNKKNQPQHPEDWVYEEAKKKNEQFIKDLLILITDIEKDANKGDWKSVQEKITKIKEWIALYSLNNQEVNELINKLEQRLLTQTYFPSSSPLPQIIIGGTTLISLGLITYFLTKKAKSILLGYAKSLRSLR